MKRKAKIQPNQPAKKRRASRRRKVPVTEGIVDGRGRGRGRGREEAASCHGVLSFL